MNNIKIQGKLILLLMLSTPLLVHCQGPSSRIKSDYYNVEEKLKNDYSKFEEELTSGYSKFEEENYYTSKPNIEETKPFKAWKVTTFDKYNVQLVLATAIAKMLNHSDLKSEHFVLMILIKDTSELIIVGRDDKEIVEFESEKLNFDVSKNQGYQTDRVYTFPDTCIEK